MKTAAIFFGILIGLHNHAFGQSAVKLTSQFGRVSCSQIRAESLNFMGVLADNPKSIGYVVVSGRDDRERFHRRWIVENEMIYRKFDPSRIVYLKRSGIRGGLTEFWVGNVNVALPFETEEAWDYVKDKRSGASIVVTGGWDDSEGAPPSNEIYLSRFLRANPGSRGNIVIRCKGTRCYNEIQKEVRSQFSKQNITRNRIRYFYLPIQDMYYSVEYWLLP